MAIGTRRKVIGTRKARSRGLRFSSAETFAACGARARCNRVLPRFGWRGLQSITPIRTACSPASVGGAYRP